MSSCCSQEDLLTISCHYQGLLSNYNCSHFPRLAPLSSLNLSPTPLLCFYSLSLLCSLSTFYSSHCWLSLLHQAVSVHLLYSLLCSPYIYCFKFIYLFLIALNLCCCVAFSPVVGSEGCSLVVVRGLLTVVASLVSEHRL